MTLIPLASNAGAFTFMKADCRTGGLEKQSKLFHQMSLIGEENRWSFPDYAENNDQDLTELEKQFQAAGELNCGGMVTRASLVGDSKEGSNVLAIVGHGLFDDFCNPINPSKCIFKVPKRKKTYKVDTKSIKSPGCNLENRSLDWGTVKLTEVVEGVEPFQIPDGPLNPTPNTPILMVSGNDANYAGKGLNIQECKIRKINRTGAWAIYPYQTDCDTGKGSSGSPQFIMNGKSLQLAAMNVAQPKTGLDKAEYDQTKQFNISVPIEGAFLSAIRENLK